MDRAKTGVVCCLVAVACFVSGCSASTGQADTPRQGAFDYDDYGLFHEPLVPFRDASLSEQEALSAAISEYAAAGDPAIIAPLADYLENSPDSPWRQSLLLNMGLARADAGYLSDSIELFEAAYPQGARADTAAARAVSSRALGELLQLRSRLGHRDELVELLTASEGFEILGSATESVTEARERLWQMDNTPDEAMRCGIVSVQNLLLANGGDLPVIRALDDIKAGPKGSSIAFLHDLAEEAGLSAEVIRKDSGQPIPVPSVMHLQVGHFATIVGRDNDHYLVNDPVFGNLLRMSAEAIEAEASGFFLVSDRRATERWHAVSNSEAGRIVGAGYTNGSDDTETKKCGVMAGGERQQIWNGMPGYSVHCMLVSLNIVDTPVSYTPPLGPAVPITLTYSQREAYQPANFTFFNLGQKWTFNWLSYVEDDPQTAGSQVQIYLPGGGVNDYSGYNSGTGVFTMEERTGASPHPSPI